MRNFTIRMGKFAGDHLIFDSIKEAEDNNIKNIKQPWYDPEVQPGDWVVSDDGYVIQCLTRRKLVNKRHKSGQYTDLFRFCNGTFYVYYKSDGTKNIKNFYAVAAQSSKGTLGNTSVLGKYMGARKKSFGLMVAKGMHPYIAYMTAYNKRNIPPDIMYIQVNKLLNDDKVRELVMSEVNDIKMEIEERLKEMGFSSISDLVVTKITEIIADNPKQFKDKSMQVKMLLDLFGADLGLVKEKKLSKEKAREIQEEEYSMAAPPQIET